MAKISGGSSTPRPRTRNQWDHHYLNLYSGNVKKNVDKSWEKYGFVFLAEKSGCGQQEKTIHHYGERDSKAARKLGSKAGVGVKGSGVRPPKTPSPDDGNIKSDDNFVDLDKSTDDSIGVKRCRGGPQKSLPLDDRQIHNRAFADLEVSKGSADKLVDLTMSEDDTTSEDDEQFSDEDYSKSSSESSYYGSYNEPGNGSAREKKKIIKGKVERMKVEEESDNERDDMDDLGSSTSAKPLNQKRKLHNSVPNMNDGHKFISIRGNKRKGSKKDSGANQEREHKGHCFFCDDAEIIDFNNEKFSQSHDDVEIMNYYGEKLSKLKTRARQNLEGDGEVAGLFRDHGSRSSHYGCKKKSKRDGDNSDTSCAECQKLGLFSKFKKEESFKNKHWGDEGGGRVERVAERAPQFRLSKKKNSGARNQDFIKILIGSINSAKEYKSCEEGNDFTRSRLPLRFRFEDEVEPQCVKSEWEKEIDSLFCGLDMGLLESEVDRANSPGKENDDDVTEIDQSPAACCARGQHSCIEDEQIGIICEYCLTVILEIKHVLPPFYSRPRGRQKWVEDPVEPPSYYVDQIHFHGSGFETQRPISRCRGTVWDLVPGVENEMYPHQREGFEFMWNNIGGGTVIDKMKQPISGGRGCIISHAPGTGKTRLAIVFLQSFLELYPSCKPVIIAPKGMLLTWESEFLKWKVNIPFHNLNKKELSENENSFAAHVLVRAGLGGGPMSMECIRLTKLASWMSKTSILGISYKMFSNLVGANKGNGRLAGQIKKLLLESPGLLVLDEGHTPRNDNSQIWNALLKVATSRRIILSGTPFQNNLAELYNTLCIVNPRFANGIKPHARPEREARGRKRRLMERKKWVEFAGSIGKETNGRLRKLRAMLDPFVHVHKGTILEEKLPGLRDTLVFLHPTERQRVLLEASAQINNIFNRIHRVSLISVHPSLEAEGKYPLDESVDAGVKTKFVMKLIRLADTVGERVLIFSQFIDPLLFIKQQIKARFSWHEGRELLYMDGKLDEKQRQDSISSFNDERSEAKVLLASERACSEGINLVGASRVVLLDTVWNPSVEKQAVSRAYRLGQRRVVYVYRLFTSGVEVRQYARQIQKDLISQLLFSPRDGQVSGERGPHQDRILEAMLGLEGFGNIFERVICQPKECELMEIFGLVGKS